MSPITSSSFTQQASRILCYYFNPTHEIQLIRVRNGKNYCLSRIIFPQQRILFEAVPEGILEIHIKREGKQLLKEIFSCLNLQINQSQPELAANYSVS